LFSPVQLHLWAEGLWVKKTRLLETTKFYKKPTCLPLIKIELKFLFDLFFFLSLSTTKDLFFVKLKIIIAQWIWTEEIRLHRKRIFCLYCHDIWSNHIDLSWSLYPNLFLHVHKRIFFEWSIQINFENFKKELAGESQINVEFRLKKCL